MNLRTDNAIPMVAAGNLALDYIVRLWSWVQPNASTLASLGQFAVAVATVVFIIKKTRSLDKPKK